MNTDQMLKLAGVITLLYCAILGAVYTATLLVSKQLKPALRELAKALRLRLALPKKEQAHEV